MRTEIPPNTLLKNGIRVMNFSSPHPFIFEDGTVLDACSKERANDLVLGVKEEVQECSRMNPVSGEILTWEDIQISYEMSQAVLDELWRLHTEYTFGPVEIILVPFPVMEAIRQQDRQADFYKVRVIRVMDRASKVCYSDKFCI